MKKTLSIILTLILCFSLLCGAFGSALYDLIKFIVSLL